MAGRGKYLVSLAAILVSLGAFVGGSVWADTGGGGGGSGITTTCSAPNAYTGLCGDNGSQGGGASWRLYSGGNVWWDGTSSTDGQWVGCGDSGYYVAFGYEQTHGATGNRATQAGHFGIMGYHNYQIWGKNSKSWVSIAYNSYGAISRSDLQDGGEWSAEKIQRAASSNGAVLDQWTAESLYFASTGRNIWDAWSNNGGQDDWSPSWFCIDPSIFKEEVYPSASSSTSLNGMAYIGETAAEPTFSYSFSASIETGGKTYSGSISSMNDKLNRKRIVTETHDITFYAADYHNGTGRLDGRTYSGSNVASWACMQFGAAVGRCYDNDTLSARKISDAEYLVGYKFCASGAARAGVQEKVYDYDANGNYTGWHWGDTAWNDWQVSGASCIPIAKKPNTAITGSNTYASGLKTVVERKHSGKVFGSWAEFLIVTGDGITASSKKVGIVGNNTYLGTSSGGGLYAGQSSSTLQTNKTKWSSESVGNKTMSGQNVPAAGVSSSNNFKDQVKSQLIDKSNGNVEVTRTNRISANVYNYETNPDKYKQKIIYSNGDLVIDKNVTRIDAWIIAEGNVDTCGNGKIGTMDANTCNTQLIINGLVYAKSITLDRTAGGVGADMAEIINLTPMSYVWAYNQAISNYANPTTVYTRELAPRT